MAGMVKSKLKDIGINFRDRFSGQDCRLVFAPGVDQYFLDHYQRTIATFGGRSTPVLRPRRKALGPQRRMLGAQRASHALDGGLRVVTPPGVEVFHKAVEQRDGVGHHHDQQRQQEEQRVQAGRHQMPM